MSAEQILGGGKSTAVLEPAIITLCSHMAYCFRLVVSNQRYQILIWVVLTLLDLTKKVDLADFHAQRSFQDHLHVFDKL